MTVKMPHSKTTMMEIKAKYAKMWRRWSKFIEAFNWIVKYPDKWESKKQDFYNNIYKPLYDCWSEEMSITGKEDTYPLLFYVDTFWKVANNHGINIVIERLEMWRDWMKFCKKKAKEYEDERFTLSSSEKSS